MGFKVFLPTPIGVVDANGNTINLNMELVSGNYYPTNGVYRGGEAQEPVRQFLSTDGGGGGTISAIGDYSATQGLFYIAPAPGVIYRIHELVMFVRDGTGITIPSSAMGASSALANGFGLTLELNNGGSILKELLGGIKIKTNADLLSVGAHLDTKRWSNDNTLQARFNFQEMMGEPLRIDGTANEDIRVRLDDDMSNLAGLTFFASGYVE